MVHSTGPPTGAGNNVGTSCFHAPTIPFPKCKWMGLDGGLGSIEFKGIWEFWRAIILLSLPERSPSPSSFSSMFFHQPWQCIYLTPQVSGTVQKYCCYSPSTWAKWQRKNNASLICFFTLPSSTPHSMLLTQTRLISKFSSVYSVYFMPSSNFLWLPQWGSNLIKVLDAKK